MSDDISKEAIMHHHCNHEDRANWQFGGRGGGPGMGWGRGPGRGGRGFGGGAFRVGKMLADGDLRVVVLALLTDGPRHGYDIIKALEERSHGVYSPSPGVVYPTLTYLEEVGYVSAASEGNKKVYTITDTGRAHLQENRDLADMVLDGIDKFGRRMAQARAWWEGERQGGKGRDRDIPGVIDEVNEARRDLKAAIAEKLEDAAEEVQRRIAKAMRDAAEAIRKAGGKGNRDDVIDL
jgi:DNA-binding PadR family transcriptional regulator